MQASIHARTSTYAATALAARWLHTQHEAKDCSFLTPTSTAATMQPPARGLDRCSSAGPSSLLACRS